MKKALLNYRYYVLAVLFTIAIIGVFSEPLDELPYANWLFVLIASKVIGFGTGYAAALLFKRWEKCGMIPELTDTVNTIK